MEKIMYPPRQQWETIAQRPSIDTTLLLPLVESIFTDIRQNGDEAVKKYCRLYDNQTDPVLVLDEAQIAAAAAKVPPVLQQAIQLAQHNIERFHRAQKGAEQVIETMPGVHCRTEYRPIDTVGLYIPGGSAPLFSTVLMLGVPARLAGCRNVLLCTPADSQGNINPAILYTAGLVGITTIFAIGGVQAIAAMTWGTATIPKADKLFGPGNQYVTMAKQYAQLKGTAIDMPAGPSEVLVIADATSNASFVAADLLSQAEHGPDSQVMLLSDNEQMMEKILAAIREQLPLLPRAAIAARALQNSKAILLRSVPDCIAFSNVYAPEHLILALDQPEDYAPGISNAGSVFLGHYSCESAGDYASGTNHTLPTNGYARSYSGISLDAFVKKISFQEISAEGLRHIGPAIELMAEAEQLWAHKNAVTLRLKTV